MKTYEVKIITVTIKTYQVEAEDESAAEDKVYPIAPMGCSPRIDHDPDELYVHVVQFYVGHTKTGPSQIVTDEFRDERFFAKTGPFKTRAAAQYMIDNPMIQTVSEVEEAMKL